MIVYVLLSLAGLYNMKRAVDIVDIHFALGLALYVGGFLVWLVILRLYPLSLAFPLAAGALVVGTQVVGWLFLDEGLAIHRQIGVALILGGLATLAFFEPRA